MTSQDLETIELRLFEDNELDLSLSLDGTDPEIKDPELRFVLVDLDDKEVSWVFKPKKNIQDGLINVKIPKGPYAMLENKTFQGSLEIILGDQYFSPTSFMIRFISPVSVKATPIKENKSSVRIESRLVPKT